MNDFFSNSLYFSTNLEMLNCDNIPFLQSFKSDLLPDFNQRLLDHSQFDFFPLELSPQPINIATLFDYNAGNQQYFNRYSFNNYNFSSISSNNNTNYFNTFSTNFLQGNINNTASAVSLSSTSGLSTIGASTPVSTPNTSPSSGKRVSRNMQWWLAQGYNPEKGRRLCQATKRHLDSNPKQANGKRKIRGQCVGFVRKGINDAFYGGKQHYRSFELACTCGEKYLSKDPNFKKITGIDLASIIPSEIPEGAVVIYHPGYSNSAASQIAGHGEVSNGKGYGYSDCLTFLKNNNKQRIKEIWIPV